jgi:IS4 transposase
MGYKDQLPIIRTLDSAVIPIKDMDYVARGRFVCFRKEVGFMDKVIVVLLHRNNPEKAWIVKDRRLQTIPIRSVVCETEDHHGD